MSKIILFEYFLKKLVDWHCEYYEIDLRSFNNHRCNNLSKLKVIKLHFFACSAYEPALDIFDDFQAMPYGHVESDVYNRLNQLRYCEVNNTKLRITDHNSFEQTTPANAHIMDTAIQNLQEKNYDLITLDPFELVELSHKWYSWRTNFNKARTLGAFSRPIDLGIIKKEEKFYSLY